MAETKQTVLVLTRCVPAAFEVANIYQERLSGRFNLLFVEEKTLTLRKSLSFVRKRFRKKGLLSVVNVLLLRLLLQFERAKPAVRKYQPIQTVEDINDPLVRELIRQERPAFVIANICSLLNAATIESIKAVGASAINVHNGINPRYRGTGNFWAVYEGNYDAMGVTVHHIDRGIDTGARICVKRLDYRGVAFEDFERFTFINGANKLADYLLNGASSIDPDFVHIRSCYYPLPGLSHYLRTRRNYRVYQSGLHDVEQVWRDNFVRSAADAARTHFQKMEWLDERTVETRDSLILKIYESVAERAPVVADIGCGDGRYMNLLPGYSLYVGCDFSLDTIQLGAKRLETGMMRNVSLPLLESRTAELKMWQEGNRVLMEGDARKLPLSNDSVDITFSVGLLQHIAKSQQVLDELYRITRKGGYIVINTLRQFSKAELALILLGSLFNSDRRKLAWSILKRDYFRGTRINGTLVAVRYTADELLQKLRSDGSNCRFFYNGLAGSRLFAREITLVARK